MNKIDYILIAIWIISAILSWGFRTGSVKAEWTSIDDVPLLAYLMFFIDIIFGPMALVYTGDAYGFGHWAWLPNKTQGEKMLHQLIIETADIDQNPNVQQRPAIIILSKLPIIEIL